MIIIIITLIILFILKFKILFTSSDPKQQFLNDTLNDRTIISNILSDSNFEILVNNVPGQTVFNIAGDPPTLTKTISEGNPQKINLNVNLNKLNEKCDQIISAINNYILIAQNSIGVYTPERLDAFVLYYQNMVNNINIIKNYIN